MALVSFIFPMAFHFISENKKIQFSQKIAVLFYMNIYLKFHGMKRFSKGFHVSCEAFYCFRELMLHFRSNPFEVGTAS